MGYNLKFFSVLLSIGHLTVFIHNLKQCCRSGSVLIWLSWIRIRVRIWNADADQDQGAKKLWLRNKTNFRPFWNAFVYSKNYYILKVHFSCKNSTFYDGKVRPESWSTWIRIGLAYWIRIAVKSWIQIRIRIETNSGSQHWFTDLLMAKCVEQALITTSSGGTWWNILHWRARMLAPASGTVIDWQ